MNQAKSRRLRACYLLLFVPLLMASTPSPLPFVNRLVLAPLPPDHLAFVGLPSEIVQGQCVPVTVEVQDSNNIPVKLAVSLLVALSSNLTGGTFYDSITCTNPATQVAISTDITSVKVWYVAQQLGGLRFSASDGANGLGDASSRSVSVVPFPTDHIKISGVPTTAQLGIAVPITVTAYDNRNMVATGYAGTIQLKATDLSAQPPAPYTFDPVLDNGTKKLFVRFYTPGSWEVVAEDVDNTALVVRSPSITVPSPKVVLDLFSPSPVQTCGEMKLSLQAVDASGFPINAFVPRVTLCKPPDRSARVVTSDLTLISDTQDCITGSFTGNATVIWTDEVAEDVVFTVTDTPTNGPRTVTWQAGPPSPAKFILSFRESLDDSPSLRSLTGQLTFQVDLRDECGTPTELLSTQQISFKAEAPLAVKGSPVQASPSRWTTTVRLPMCPPPPSTPLAIWPLINQEPLFKANNERVERRVMPLCLPAAVQIALHPEGDGGELKPGAGMELEVEVSNDAPESLTGGVLMLSTSGLDVLEASIDDQPLRAFGEGFKLPELSNDAPLKVKIKAQTTTQFEQKQVNAEVWCANLEGLPLTEKKLVTFGLKDVGVNVGCGCHATTLPSQLLPWLALLLAASRPWERLRRLRRSERTDR